MYCFRRCQADLKTLLLGLRWCIGPLAGSFEHWQAPATLIPVCSVPLSWHDVGCCMQRALKRLWLHEQPQGNPRPYLPGCLMAEVVSVAACRRQ